VLWLANHKASASLPPSARHLGENSNVPESDIVQTHACQHEQDAVPQHPLVVFVLLLSQLRPLGPHTRKLGPVLSIGGCPGASEKEKGQGRDEALLPGDLGVEASGDRSIIPVCLWGRLGMGCGSWRLWGAG
jgi:hypothetical protein